MVGRGLHSESLRAELPRKRHSRTLTPSPRPATLQTLRIKTFLSTLPASAANEPSLSNSVEDEGEMRSAINLPINTGSGGFLCVFVVLLVAVLLLFLAKHLEMLQKDYTPSAKWNKEALCQGNGQVMANTSTS